MFSEENEILYPKLNIYLMTLEEKIARHIIIINRVFSRRRARFRRRYSKRLTLTLNLNHLALSLLLSQLSYYLSYNFFKKTNKHFAVFKKVLMLNYRRGRFFPSIQNTSNHVYTTFSLGMFSKFFKKGKSFIKNKANYLVSAGFLRKILTYASIKDLILLVKRTPLYLTETLTTINSPVIVNYKHPFNSTHVDEMKFSNYFFYHYFIFFNTKAYGFMKGRKKGRVKRKITKRIVKINRLTD